MQAIQKRLSAWLIALCAIAMAGCYPIELDSAGGKVLIPREEGFFQLNPADGTATCLFTPNAGEQPIFGLYTPDAKSIIAVTQTGGGMMGSAHNYTLVTLADKKQRKLFTGANGAYCQVSPDGNWLSVAQVSQQAKPPMEQNMPEIHLVSIADGTTRAIASNTGTRHCWLPDSSGVIVFEALVKDEQNGYSGSFSIIPTKEGEAKKPLLTLMGEELFYDLSPDGKTLLIVANAAAVGEEKLTPGESNNLFELTLEGAKLRKVMPGVKFAFYSPTGEKVLLGMTEGQAMGPGGGDFALQVTDKTLADPKTLATDAAASVGGMGNNADVYPVWLDAEAIAYLAEKAVYGTAGKNLMLMTIKADGTGATNLQATIDAAAIGAKKDNAE